MDLIYADIINGQIIDRGVLHNYSLDLSYGESENDFELKIPLKGIHLVQDQIIYIPGTEYGGIIDNIKVDTINQMLIYSGRTWHGILENKILYPRKGESYFTVEGDANEVIADLLERMNLTEGDYNEIYLAPEGAVLRASTEESGIYVSASIESESGNYAHGYSFIRDLLYGYSAKPQIIDGVISAVSLVDYSNDDDFLEGTDQFTAKRNYNSLNRIHCMGQGDWNDRYEIDIFMDRNGGILPFCRYMGYFNLSGASPAVGELTDDNDYYTDIAALAGSSGADKENFDYLVEHMVTGINEIAEIYDYPSASTTYHYILQLTIPSDWETDLTPEKELSDKEWGFEKYYILTVKDDGTASYENVKKPSIATGYTLQLEEPDDWISNFAEYYEQDNGGWKKVSKVTEYDVVGTMPSGWYNGEFENYYRLTDGGNYSKVRKVSKHIQLTSPPEDWSTDWGDYSYYDSESGSYKKVKGVKPAPRYVRVKKKPTDWSKKFNEYYVTDGVEYRKVTGVSYDKYIEQTVKPSDWKKNWKNYYKCVNKKYVQLTGSKAPTWKAKTYYTKESQQKAPKWDKNKIYYEKIQDDEVAPNFYGGTTYYTKGEVVPEWGSETFYKKRTYPNWTTNKYYYGYKYQPIPEWFADNFFTKYADHYESLIKGALQKIQKSNIQNELSITLDETRVYDINDRVGASDEVTGIGAVERIVQKVVKIERGIVSFDYSTGK